MFQNGESFLICDRNETLHIFDILLNRELKYSLCNCDNNLSLKYENAIKDGIYGLSLYSSKSQETLIFGDNKMNVYCFTIIHRDSALSDALNSVFM